MGRLRRLAALAAAGLLASAVPAVAAPAPKLLFRLQRVIAADASGNVIGAVQAPTSACPLGQSAVADLRLPGIARRCVTTADSIGLGPQNVRAYAVGAGKSWLVQQECCGNFDYYDLYAARVPRAPVGPEQAVWDRNDDTGAQFTALVGSAGAAVVVTSEARITDPTCDDTMQDPRTCAHAYDARVEVRPPGRTRRLLGTYATAAFGGLAGRVATDGRHVVVRRPGSLALVEVYDLAGVRSQVTLAPAPTGVARVLLDGPRLVLVEPGGYADLYRLADGARLARLALRRPGAPRLATLHGNTLVSVTGGHLDALRFTDGHRAALLGGLGRAFMLRAIAAGVVYARPQPRIAGRPTGFFRVRYADVKAALDAA
jgi:hypothetical protein